MPSREQKWGTNTDLSDLIPVDLPRKKLKSKISSLRGWVFRATGLLYFAQ